MLIPENALHSKVVMSEKELKKIQAKFADDEPQQVGKGGRGDAKADDKITSF